MSNDMIILCDSRENRTAHILQGFSEANIKFKVKGLKFGDYSFIKNGRSYENIVIIERKANLLELCGNFTAGRMRFAKEFEKAAAAGAKIILLIEDAASREKMRLRRELDETKDIDMIKSIFVKFFTNSIQTDLSETNKKKMIDKYQQKLNKIDEDKMGEYILKQTWESKFRAKSLINSLGSWKQKYNLDIVFVDKNKTAETIIDIFNKWVLTE